MIVQKILQLALPCLKKWKKIFISVPISFSKESWLDESKVLWRFATALDIANTSSLAAITAVKTLFPFPIPYTGSSSSHITVYKASVWTDIVHF